VPARTRTWPTISPAVRFRTSPIVAVRQKAQPMAQPTCVDTQKVSCGVRGMNTDSTWRPSWSASRNFSVPSSETSRRAMGGVKIRNRSASAVRCTAGRSVMAAKSVTPRR